MKDCVMSVEDYKPVELVGGVFRKGGINMIYGASGLGKTVSTIKALNAEDIEPILIDFDENDSPADNNCHYTHVLGTRAVAKGKDLQVPSNCVIVIDTWVSATAVVGSESTLLDWVKMLQGDTNTIILIAHNKDIATKKDIPDVDEKIVNQLSAKLHMYYQPGKAKTAKTPAKPDSVGLEVLKLRGYKGPRKIMSWMR